MEQDTRVVEFKTESVEGPVMIIVDKRHVLTIDLKATPGLLHIVLPPEFRLREVPHTSPRVDEGVHHAVLYNHDYGEAQRLQAELYNAGEQAAALQRLATAYAQGAPPQSESGKASEAPVLLEVWKEDIKEWQSGYWHSLEAGTRFRRRDPLSGVLLEEEGGHIDMECTGPSTWTDGTWRVEYDACETNHGLVDRDGRILPGRSEDGS